MKQVDLLEFDLDGSKREKFYISYLEWVRHIRREVGSGNLGIGEL